MLSVYSHSPEKNTYLLETITDKAHFSSDVVQTDPNLSKYFIKIQTIYSNTHFIFQMTFYKCKCVWQYKGLKYVSCVNSLFLGRLLSPPAF